MILALIFGEERIWSCLLKAGCVVEGLKYFLAPMLATFLDQDPLTSGDLELMLSRKTQLDWPKFGWMSTNKYILTE